jgi:uncharacterized protein YcbX
MTVTLAQIHRFPVKGLAGERLPAVTLAAGQALPYDRRYALAMGGGGIDLSGQAWINYRQLYALSSEERLAQLGLAFDEATETVVITRGGKQVARGKPGEPLGRSLLDQFFAAFLSGSPRGAPKLVAGQVREGRAVAFTDSERPTVSLLNLASVADLERVARAPVDPRRFRANLWLDGLPAWSEMTWPGQEVTVGAARLKVIEPIERCSATAVNLETAQRDLAIPRILQQGYGHLCMGVYAEVVAGGQIAEGDAVALAG